MAIPTGQVKWLGLATDVASQGGDSAEQAAKAVGQGSGSAEQTAKAACRGK